MADDLRSRLRALEIELDNCIAEVDEAKKVSKKRSGVLKMAMANLQVLFNYHNHYLIISVAFYDITER